jgi:hypothetical protein
MNFEALPGGDLVAEGLRDLAGGRDTIPALLVSVAATRLRSLGVPVPDTAFSEPEHRLYLRLAAEDPRAAHSRYNALIRRLVSFQRALACAN